MSGRQESEIQEPTSSQIIEELQQAKIKAEQATEAKSQFLARMSHEIRTPLTSMLGYADLLSDFDLTIAERANAMDALRNNGRHLLRLLDDILDLSRVESGQLSVDRVLCRTNEILQEVLRLMKPRAEMKGLSLALE
ncbi:MAG: hybrid sensor histidine kinase/response regulator, partial [Planctomycetaceae bacterium]|nr:hybrid sensor histidine kinase/response regulator [Planctomycetaceae bacterium]